MINSLIRIFSTTLFLLGSAAVLLDSGNAADLTDTAAGDPASPLRQKAGLDTWQAVMVIDEGHPFDLAGSESGLGALREFRFHVRRAVGRVTPFVARKLADNAFQVRFIGKTRVAGIDFTREDVGQSVAFPFSEDAAAIEVRDGWLAGFLAANADGTQAAGSPISYDDDGNEVWLTGGLSAGDGGRLAVGSAPFRGTSLVLDAARTYAFQATAIPAAAEPAPPCDLGLASAFVPTSAAAGTKLATVLALDPNPGDTFGFALVQGTGSADNRWFQIEGNALVVADDLPGEVRSYEVRLQVVDQTGLTLEKPFVVLARPHLPPTRVAVDTGKIPLGTRAGRRLAVLSAEDPNAADFGDWHTFDLVPGEGDFSNDRFAILEDRLIWRGEVPTPGQDFAIRIRATDRTGLAVENAFEMTTEPLAETLIGNEVTGRKTSRSDTTLAFYTNFAPMPSEGVVDAVDIYFQGQTEAQTFHLLQLRPADAFGYDVVFDSGEIVPVGLQDEPVRLRFPHGSTQVEAGDIFAHHGTGIPLNLAGTGTGTDTGDNFHPVFIPAALPRVGDCITLPGVVLRDSGGPWRDYAWAVHFAPTDPLPPTAIVAEPRQIALGAAAGAVVAVLGAVDPNPSETHEFRLLNGFGDRDNARFRIEGSSLVLAKALDVPGDLSLRIEAHDRDGMAIAAALEFTVLQAQGPKAIAFAEPAIFARSPRGTVVTRLRAVDPDIPTGDRHRFELAKGPGDDDNGYFSIEGDALSLAQALPEDRASVRLRLRTTDDGGREFERAAILPIARLLGGDPGPREADGSAPGDGSVFFTNFVPAPERGLALGVSHWAQSGEGRFSVAQIRASGRGPSVFNVIHSSGNLSAAPGANEPGLVHLPFPSGPSRVETGDFFGTYGDGLPYTERNAAVPGFVPIYRAPLRPTRPNIITLGSPAFRLAASNARDYAWAIQWLPDSRRDLDPDQDGDGLPDAWELEALGTRDDDAFGDADGDRLPNLLEYYAASDPARPGVPIALTAMASPDDPGRIAVTYRARQVEGIERHLFIERSGDLQAWLRSTAPAGVVSAAGGLAEIRSAIASEPDAPLYLRLRAVP